MPFFRATPSTDVQSNNFMDTPKSITMDSKTIATAGGSGKMLDSTDTPPATPTAMAASAHDVVNEIQAIYNKLSKLADLSPSPVVNSNLSRLVELCIKPFPKDFTTYVLSLPGVPDLSIRLRDLCSTAEGLLETHWAQRLLTTPVSHPASASDREALLRNFIYYQNYVDLTRIECATLEAFLPLQCPDRAEVPQSLPSQPRRICFIGSGPLPLTTFCVLDRYPRATVHNIDRDRAALSISRQLAEKLGYADRMTSSDEDISITCSKSTSESPWSEFNIVFLAALVGINTAIKLTILESLAKGLRPGTLVVARSAHGLRSVLYPVLELSDDLMKCGYDILAEVHPWSEVVNSIIVLRVKEL